MIMKTCIHTLRVATIAVTVFLSTVQAQNQIEWFSIDAAGGGFDSTANRIIYHSVGQPFAGVDSSAAGMLYSGYLSIFVAHASVPRLILSGTTIDFGVVTVNTPSRKSVTLSSAGSSVVTISNQDVTGAAFRLATAASGTIMNGTPGTAEIEFLPTVEGDFTGTFTFSSNDPAKPTVTVQLKGTGSQSTRPKLSLNMATLDYGNLPVLSSKDLSVTITNIGTSDLVITAQTLVGSDSGDFSVTQAAQGAVVPNASTTLTVRHTPKTPGFKTASVRIESNDPASPITPVILISNAVTNAVGATSLPRGPALLPGYPNPFILSTHQAMTFVYELSRAVEINLSVTDAIGRNVAILASGWHDAGLHHASFVPDTRLPAGTYTAVLRIGIDGSQKMLSRAFTLMK